MKKLFLAAVMAAFALVADAQKGDIHITPHVGIGYSHLSSMPDANNDANAFMLGAEAEYMTSDNFGISLGADLQYVMTEEHKNDVQTEWRNFNLMYLNIPVLAQYHIGQFAVKAGLQPTLLLSANYKVGSDKESVKKDLKTFSLALPIGITYEFKKTPIVLGATCAIPLTKQNKKGDFYMNPDGMSFVTGNEGNTKLLTVMLSVGYRF